MFDSSTIKTSSLKSPIFWRIAAGVFASIMLIEVILLVYSWTTERSRVLERLDDSLVTMTSLLNRDNPIPQLENLLNNQSKNTQHRVIGYLYISASGNRSSGGEADGIQNSKSDSVADQYDSTTGSYVSFQALANSNAPDDKLWLKTDATWVGEYMQSYVWRIVGMILLISLFVTVAGIVFLNPIVIHPLQRLKNALARSEKLGIRGINLHDRDLKRTDEMGSVFRSLSKLQNDLIRAEEDKTRMSERFEEFANLGADCFWEVDRDFNFTYFSGDVTRILQLNAEQMIGKNFSELVAVLEDRVPHAESMFESLTHNGNWEGKVTPIEAGDPPISVRVVASIQRDASGKRISTRGTVIDISKETKLASELQFQATHDELTGLSNRRHLSSQIDANINRFREEGVDFTLLVLDLDRFKYVNDTAGHPAGDALLKILARKFQNVVRESDIVARMGGDEFAIILRSCSIGAATTVADNIRKAIESFTFNWNQESYTVTVSIGIAQVSTSLITQEALVFAADSCCLKAKQQGKNQIHAYTQGDASISLYKDEAIWVNRITKALDQDQFSLFRQSIICIDRPKSEEHFEILLRMKNDENGFWPPNFFLPVAERNHLMPQIDKWVVSNAIKWLKKQSIDKTLNYCMNINLSAASLADTGFRTFLVDCVHANMEVNKYICFEMTESAAMINYEETLALLKQLKQAGCRIALDDFGTGFSSLSHIRELPLDYIKIDGRFIQELGENEVDQAVVKSVAEIAKVLRIKTVAEFVDSEAKLNLLEDLEIDYAQGFLFSKPYELGDQDEGSTSEAA